MALAGVLRIQRERLGKKLLSGELGAVNFGFHVQLGVSLPGNLKGVFLPRNT